MVTNDQRPGKVGLFVSVDVRLGPHMLRGKGMHLFQLRKTTVITLALLVGSSWAAVVSAQSTAAQPKPDNTAVNKRDRNPGEATADQQKVNPADRALTAKIRSAVGASGVTGVNLYSLLVAVVGSVALLVAYHALFRRTA
jgi:hypothetical protein